MAPVTNKRTILKEFLTDLPVPGQTIDLDTVPLNGGVLLKALVLSLEHYILHNETFCTCKAVLSPSRVLFYGITGYGIGFVVRSEDPAFQVGDHLHGSLTYHGSKGQTAYFGWKEYSRAKKGEVAFVNSGVGAIGPFVIQLVKKGGMELIASDDKVQFTRELGADVAFNYKTTWTSEILEKEDPIDVYWDDRDVGGETLEAALNAVAKHARFIECGMVSAYGGTPKPVSNLFDVIVKEISINGFVVSTQISPKYLESFEREVPALLASKDLVYREDATRGLEKAEVALDNFLKGAFIEKSVVIVADE